jgi:hypothetical protein
MSDRITQRLLRNDQREPRLTIILEIAPPSEIVPDTILRPGCEPHAMIDAITRHFAGVRLRGYLSAARARIVELSGCKGRPRCRCIQTSKRSASRRH